MSQYSDLGKRIVEKGKWTHYERFPQPCKVVISERFTYDCSDNKIELPHCAKTNWRWAIAELLGYIRGYTSAEDFRKLGTLTWDANANQNASWLNNPHRKGEDDMGVVYGGVGNNWPKISMDGDSNLYHQSGDGIDLLDAIYCDLLQGKDNRGEIWSFWNPGMFHLGCLRPCLHGHQFSVLDGELYLDSTQRSVDHCLGLKFNMVQVQVLLQLMAQITKLKVGKDSAVHNMVNVHIYEDQYDIYVNEQLPREPVIGQCYLKINPEIKTLEDVRDWVTVDDFEIVGYDPMPFIRYPFQE